MSVKKGEMGESVLSYVIRDGDSRVLKNPARAIFREIPACEGEV